MFPALLCVIGERAKKKKCLQEYIRALAPLHRSQPILGKKKKRLQKVQRSSDRVEKKNKGHTQREEPGAVRNDKGKKSDFLEQQQHAFQDKKKKGPYVGTTPNKQKKKRKAAMTPKEKKKTTVLSETKSKQRQQQQ